MASIRWPSNPIAEVWFGVKVLLEIHVIRFSVYQSSGFEDCSCPVFGMKESYSKDAVLPKAIAQPSFQFLLAPCHSARVMLGDWRTHAI